MSFETIRYEKKDHVGIVTLNRPERLNAVNVQMIMDLRQVMSEIENDDDVRVLMMTGAPRPDGRPCFCGGADLKEGLPKIAAVTLEANEMLNRIEEMLKPSIAVIDGVCTAGGIELVEACTFRLAAETAQISDLHLKNIGTGIGAWGASTRLPRIVGTSRAKQLILTGGVLDGRKAERWGFANEVFPSEKLMEGAMEFARAIAGMRPEGVKLTLAHMNLAERMGLHDALDWAGLAEKYVGISHPRAEVSKAFQEKRRVDFDGGKR